MIVNTLIIRALLAPNSYMLCFTTMMTQQCQEERVFYTSLRYNKWYYILSKYKNDPSLPLLQFLRIPRVISSSSPGWWVPTNHTLCVYIAQCSLVHCAGGWDCTGQCAMRSTYIFLYVAVTDPDTDSLIFNLADTFTNFYQRIWSRYR